MKTFLKVLLVLAILLLVAHFWPIALLPIALAAVVTLVFGSLFAGLIALVLGLIVAIAVPLLAVALVIVAATAPAWVPLLIILGIVRLCRGPRRATA